ncbi:uncharacterized protein [Medicago truncatula]|nr:uncharacterized protein LOC120576933 isoform X1 [Medicago truncatula]
MDAKTLCISNFMLVNLNMRSSYLGECFEMELSTPNLCTFEFGVTPLPKLCGSKSNLSSIKHAYIDVSMLVNDADTPLILPSWLLELANIKWLTITSRTLEVLTLIPDLFKVEFHSLCKLKSLDVKINSSFISKSEILRDAKLEQATTKSWKEDAKF